MDKKPCIHCKRILPLDDFYKHPETADGRLTVCKKCHSERAKLRSQDPKAREHDRDRAAAYRAANREAYYASKRAASAKYAASEKGKAAATKRDADRKERKKLEGRP